MIRSAALRNAALCCSFLNDNTKSCFIVRITTSPATIDRYQRRFSATFPNTTHFRKRNHLFPREDGYGLSEPYRRLPGASLVFRLFDFTELPSPRAPARRLSGTHFTVSSCLQPVTVMITNPGGIVPGVPRSAAFEPFYAFDPVLQLQSPWNNKPQFPLCWHRPARRLFGTVQRLLNHFSASALSCSTPWPFMPKTQGKLCQCVSPFSGWCQFAASVWSCSTPSSSASA